MEVEGEELCWAQFLILQPEPLQHRHELFPGLHGLQTSIREKNVRGSTLHPWVATGSSWSIHYLQENYVAYSFLSCSSLLIFILHTIFNKGRQSTYRTHSRPRFSTFIVCMVTWDCLE